MRLCRPLRLLFSTTNTPRPAAPEPSINIGSIPSLKIPNAEHHAILGVDRNTNVEEIKKQYITRTKLYSSRTPTIIEKESQMRALQESYDVMTSYYHLAEIRELPEGNFTKYELIGMLGTACVTCSGEGEDEEAMERTMVDPRAILRTNFCKRHVGPLHYLTA
jgi:hypothetical protein